MSDVIASLKHAQAVIEPRYKALRAADSALRTALRLATADKADALPMYKALGKLKAAAAMVDDEALDSASAAFEQVTQAALDSLAFDFAKDLKESFEAKGLEVTGRPPTLIVDPLVLTIDIARRKAQWFYGKEALSRPLSLSLSTILKAYEQAHKTIVARTLEADFLVDLKQAWDDVQSEKSRRSGRVNIIEVYSRLVLNRQSKRFWNAPSSKTFKDYPRALFVRDLVLVQASEAFSQQRFRLAVASKSQAENSMRSLWLPASALEGEYYGEISFD